MSVISGRFIDDKTGVGVGGITVKIFDEFGTQKGATVHTDEEGNFAIDVGFHLLGWDAILRAYKFGYKPFSIRQDNQGGGNQDFSFGELRIMPSVNPFDFLTVMMEKLGEFAVWIILISIILIVILVIWLIIRYRRKIIEVGKGVVEAAKEIPKAV